jgi:hypothetical protein
MMIMPAALALAGCNGATRILANHENVGAVNPTGGIAQTQLKVGPYKTGAMVLVSAQGASAYTGGGGVSTGIIVSIGEGKVLVEDDSFEGQASNVMYRAAVSHSFYLPKGTARIVRARTINYGSGSAGNKPSSIHMDLVALSAQP